MDCNTAFAKPLSARHLVTRNTVTEIKAAIARLSLEERAEIIAELCGWTDDDWDRQMKADVAAGKFAALNREADTAQATGQTLLIPMDRARERGFAKKDGLPAGVEIATLAP